MFSTTTTTTIITPTTATITTTITATITTIMFTTLPRFSSQCFTSKTELQLLKASSHLE
jgi:hypothetical protein